MAPLKFPPVNRYLITSALPYANGPIHIGHLAGAYLPADIYTRFLKFKGFDAIHICGTDEHGVAITLAAYKEGISPRQLVDKYHDRIKKDFELMGIEFDHFSRTTRKIHYETSQKFFLRLHEKGYFEKRKVKQFYSPQEGKFLPDRYIIGTCPYCGYEEARGDQCEKCGRQLEPTQLINPRSAISGSSLELRETVHWFFKLSSLKRELEEWLKDKDWKPFVKEFALSWVEEIEDRAITRDLDWGVPVPLEDPDAKGKVLYVWFDAPIGYISATIEYLPDRWEDYWKDPQAKIIHFIGKDNIVFHTVIWPAMLMAHGEYNLPYDVPANAFLNLMGRKLSTSRGYAIWADELVNSVGQDIARYAIALYIPEKDDTDFNVREAFERTNSELVDSFGNLAHRVLSFINANFGGRVPHPNSLTSEDEELLNYISEKVSNYERNLLNYNFRLAQKDAVELSNAINRYFEHRRPWKLVKENPDRAKTVLFLSYQALKIVSALFYPYVPNSVMKLWDYMNLPAGKFDDFVKVSPDLAGNTIKESKVLYRKVEEDKINEWVDILNKRAGNERISIEDFKKVKMVIGRVLEAEKVKGTDKLLKLKVDIGNEVRTIVAGIAESYSENEIVGKKVVIVANLEKKRIRGIESDGMLLAATGRDGKPVIISPEGEVPEGSEVS
jgi:methionyl-tRNA synthetase